MANAPNKMDMELLSYVRAKNKNTAHSKLLEIFISSGVSKESLAIMLGVELDQVAKWLGSPDSRTLDEMSDIVFALTGEFFVINLSQN